MEATHTENTPLVNTIPVICAFGSAGSAFGTCKTTSNTNELSEFQEITPASPGKIWAASATGQHWKKS